MSGQAPKSVASLVAYQDGAVVSRQILKSGAGSVTLFAFDAGEGLSEHTTPHDALVHVVDGKAEVTIGRQAHRLGTGEMILLPADVPHTLAAPERFKMMLVMLRSSARADDRR